MCGEERTFLKAVTVLSSYISTLSAINFHGNNDVQECVTLGNRILQPQRLYARGLYMKAASPILCCDRPVTHMWSDVHTYFILKACTLPSSVYAVV